MIDLYEMFKGVPDKFKFAAKSKYDVWWLYKDRPFIESDIWVRGQRYKLNEYITEEELSRLSNTYDWRGSLIDLTEVRDSKKLNFRTALFYIREISNYEFVMESNDSARVYNIPYIRTGNKCEGIKLSLNNFFSNKKEQIKLIDKDSNSYFVLLNIPETFYGKQTVKSPDALSFEIDWKYIPENLDKAVITLSTTYKIQYTDDNRTMVVDEKSSRFPIGQQIIVNRGDS